MKIDDSGNMELTAEENQALMDQLKIHPRDYDDPPVSIDFETTDEGSVRFRATNTRTGQSVVLVFDSVEDTDEDE